MSTTLQRRRGNAISSDSSSGALSPHLSDGESAVSVFSGNVVAPSLGTSSTRTGPRRKRRRCNLQGQYVVGTPLGVFCLGAWLFILLLLWQKMPAFPIQLPTAGIDIDVTNATDWPLIHIVNTRFMQEQGPLTTLGMARLHLFLTFCFPTMIDQTVQNFFWIIKTDPVFTHNDVFDQLLETVRPHPNIYIVASNHNFLISPDQRGCWRDGEEGMDLLRSKIYTGDIYKLHQAIALRNDLPILETRLDADDGLHKLYLQYIQDVAMKRFSSSDSKPGDDKGGIPIKWLYWCTRRHIEWHSVLNSTAHSHHQDESSIGLLNPVQHSKLCVTPGITVGYNSGVDAQEVPVQAHDLLYKHLANSTACYASESDEEVPEDLTCLDLVEELLFSAIRSRTWTSAGMQNVDLQHGEVPKPKMVAKMWELLELRFNMNRTTVRATQQYLLQHKKEIAYENLLGQCTSFHSCKQQAKEELKQYIEEAADTDRSGDTITVIHQLTDFKTGLRPSWRPSNP